MLKNIFHIEFAYPLVLLLLLFLPAALFWYYANEKKKSPALTVTTTFFLQRTGNWRTNLRHLPFWFRCLGLAFIIIAMARPQQAFTETEINGEGIDIVLCFDISGSMTEKDILPNRLEASKEVAREFVANRPGDRIGIVIFSSLSFTLCPITSDHQTVLSQIGHIESGYLKDEGTAIGSGLATSVDRLRQTEAKSKVVVLLTDGVDFGGLISPDIAREMAKLYGIKVYTIGIGSESEIEVPVETPFGSSLQKKKLEYNEALLKSLATETGGQYFHATSKESLKGIYDSIGKLEKSHIQVKTYDRYTEKYRLPLMIGISLIAIELLLRLSVFKRFP
ncbi:MAG TPA: VWA domain-containing protein [Chitinophagaceae bacterium]